MMMGMNLSGCSGCLFLLIAGFGLNSPLWLQLLLVVVVLLLQPGHKFRWPLQPWQY